MKISCIFAWYDLWIGLFYDYKKKRLFFFPVPMFGICLETKNNTEVKNEKD
jgi:hypothetical protein